MTEIEPVANIFISYRRQDSADISGRIYARLAEHFGHNAVFKDVDAVPFGVNFRNYLEDILAQCAVELVVIGPHWLEVRGGDGRRCLDDPTDVVRIEVRSGLRRGVPIFPVLVGSASMPDPERLPSGLTELASLTGIPVRPEPDFNQDMDHLIRRLERYLLP